MENTNKVVTNQNENIKGSLDAVLSINKSHQVIAVERKNIKQKSTDLLKKVLNILKNSSEYNNALDERNADYKGVNHTYLAVSRVFEGAGELTKPTEKIVKSVLRFLLMTKREDFSFFESLKDLEIYSQYIPYFDSCNIYTNEDFIRCLDRLNLVKSTQKGLITDKEELKLPKPLRQLIGKKKIEVKGEEISLVAFFKAYDLDFSKIDSDGIDEIYRPLSVAYKEFYSQD